MYLFVYRTQTTACEQTVSPHLNPWFQSLCTFAANSAERTEKTLIVLWRQKQQQLIHYPATWHWNVNIGSRWGERNKTSKQKRETFRTRVKSFFHRLNLWLDHFAEIKKQQQQPWTIKLHPQNIMFLDKEPIYASCLGTARKNKKGDRKKVINLEKHWSTFCVLKEEDLPPTHNGYLQRFKNR